MRTIGFLISALKALVTGGGVSLASLGKGKLLAHGDLGNGLSAPISILPLPCRRGQSRSITGM